MAQGTLFTDSEAVFSPCRKYRYSLTRRWGEGGLVQFVGLNPSTADETANDATVRRCINFARDWGFGGLLMSNAYAFRSTAPADMKKQSDPVGELTDQWLHRDAERASLTVAAWGVHCSAEREAEVIRVIAGPVECLGKTKAGRPKHPLYLRKDTQRIPFADGQSGNTLAPSESDGFRVQRRMCVSCIYRPDSPLDIEELEAAISDGYGGFDGHRQCHHSQQTPVCCRGFWDRHKNSFSAGQLAQRLQCVSFVDVDELNFEPHPDAEVYAVGRFPLEGDD